MKILQKEFTRAGFKHTQIERKGNIAIYHRIHKDSNSEKYEVIKVQSHNGRTIHGNEVPPSEYYPSDTTWGRLGWTFFDLERAKEKFNELVK